MKKFIVELNDYVFVFLLVESFLVLLPAIQELDFPKIGLSTCTLTCSFIWFRLRKL